MHAHVQLTYQCLSVQITHVRHENRKCARLAHATATVMRARILSRSSTNCTTQLQSITEHTRGAVYSHIDAKIYLKANSTPIPTRIYPKPSNPVVDSRGE